MRFHFECYALCEMDIDPATERFDEYVSATLIDFFGSKEDAQLHIDVLTKGKEMDHAEYRKKWRYLRVPAFVPPTFQIVSLANMEFRWLFEVESMIEKAAVLQQQGCGIEAAK